MQQKTTFEASPNVRKYMDIIRNTDELPKELELEYVAKARKNPDFKKALFAAHLKLVVGMAKRYSSHNETFEDLIQEGVCGLEHALEKFDPKFKLRFNTYARYWVRAYILKYFGENVRTFKVPADVSDQLFKINKAIESLSRKPPNVPSDEEVAQELGGNCDKNYVSFLRKYLIPHVALDSAALSHKHKDTRSHATIGDTLEDPERDNASESLIRLDGIAKIRDAIKKLPEKERFVIENRYALNGADEDQTLEDIGNKMGLTAERVRQIQRVAEARLKKAIDR